MAQVQKSSATLRIIGDDLVPAEISDLLNCQPSSARTKGEALIGKSGAERTAKTGMWSLYSSDQKPADLDGQIQEILSKLTQSTETWQMVAHRYRIDLFCGLFMNGGNEGVSISPTSLLALGERGIELGLDVYGPE